MVVMHGSPFDNNRESGRIYMHCDLDVGEEKIPSHTHSSVVCGVCNLKLVICMVPAGD
jgi:hypothetical protein